MINKLTAVFNWIFSIHCTGTIRGRKIVIDNMCIKNAKLINCEIFYGGSGFTFDNVLIDGCTFNFFGRAANTCIFMKRLSISGADDVIRKTFPEAFA